MSLPQRLPAALDALSDKEQEILGLLTAGHTVKSIAVRLGRSEASINERLRDARRKTGFGSSRELARILAAQKTWDNNIDLPVGDAKANDAVQPQQAGPTSLKGKIVMLLVMPVAAAAIVMVGANSAHQPVATQAVQSAPVHQALLVGGWSLDVKRVPAEERPRSVTMRFSVSPHGTWTTVVDMSGPDGAIRHAESTAALDGVPAPVTGNMDFIDSVSLRQPAPGTLVMTLGKGGGPVSTRVYTVARDGRTMTETIVWPGQTMPKLETNHFSRID